MVIFAIAYHVFYAINKAFQIGLVSEDKLVVEYYLVVLQILKDVLKLNFKKNSSMTRGQRIDVLNSYKKNVLFCKYWVVMPAFYRDVNFQSSSSGKISHPTINIKYSKLIRMAALIKDSNSFDFV